MKNFSINQKKIRYCIFCFIFEITHFLFYGDFEFPKMISQGELHGDEVWFRLAVTAAFSAFPIVIYLFYSQKQSDGILTLFSLFICNPEAVNYSLTPSKSAVLVLLYIYLLVFTLRKKYANTLLTALFIIISVLLDAGSLFTVAPLIITVYLLSHSEKINVGPLSVFSLGAFAAFISTGILIKFGVSGWITASREFSFKSNIHFSLISVLRYILLVAAACFMICEIIKITRRLNDQGDYSDHKSKYHGDAVNQVKLPLKRKLRNAYIIFAAFSVSVFGELFTSCSSTVFMLIIVSALILTESSSEIKNKFIRIDSFFENHLILWILFLICMSYMYDYFGNANSFFSAVTNFFF